MPRCEYKGKKCEEDGICSIMKSAQDNLSLRCVGEWSKDKIEYFNYYAQMFSTGMKAKWHDRYYIDLFSGPGKCVIRETMEEIKGSPLNALNVKDKFSGYFFVDKNNVCILDLKKRIATSMEKIKFFPEDCNMAIEKVVSEIPEYSLSLIIIDPASLQFNFNSFNKLSKIKGDLIVNYPIYPIERAISAALAKSDYNSSKLDKFHPGWREIVARKSWGDSKKQNIKNLMKDYINKIESLGYLSAVPIPFKNSKNATLYFLIYFSKNQKGIEFWEKEQASFANKKRQLALI